MPTKKVGICPVCGEKTRIMGCNEAGLYMASCEDVFPPTLWENVTIPECSRPLIADIR